MDEDTGMYLAYAKNGDPEIFRQLWNKYQGPVLNTLMRVTWSGKAEAEDLLQEVFVKVIEQRAKFRPQAKFSTWLYRLAVNRAFNAVRDRKNNVAADETLEDTHQAPALDTLVQKEQQVRVRAALGQLNERQRAALVLREFADKSYAEIAEIMESSIEAVESLLFHARTRLRQLIREQPS